MKIERAICIALAAVAFTAACDKDEKRTTTNAPATPARPQPGEPLPGPGASKAPDAPRDAGKTSDGRK